MRGRGRQRGGAGGGSAGNNAAVPAGGGRGAPPEKARIVRSQTAIAPVRGRRCQRARGWEPKERSGAGTKGALSGSGLSGVLGSPRVVASAPVSVAPAGCVQGSPALLRLWSEEALEPLQATLNATFQAPPWHDLCVERTVRAPEGGVFSRCFGKAMNQ